MVTAEAQHDITAWFTARVPDDWRQDVLDVRVDREEILVIAQLGPAETPVGDEGRIARFREETRVERMQIAREAQARFGRIVSWGVQAGDTVALFTTASVPVMTRLRQRDRIVLDTLVDSGVARSRSDALAWCVRLVGQHQEQWIEQLRQALVAVDEVRKSGPEV